MTKKRTNNSHPILPGVTLCAIVRDEMQNPAGGIKDFLATHLSLVDHAVIVDTGSIDGTREVLEDTKKIHPGLRVYDHEFKGFSFARNYSIGLATTPYVLVLDADERLFPTEAAKLARDMRCSDPDIYTVRFDEVYHPDDKGNRWDVPEQPERLFRTDKGLAYVRGVYEYLVTTSWATSIKGSLASIAHFLPSKEDVVRKKRDLYLPMKTNGLFIPPSSIPGCGAWKRTNPKRAMYPIIKEIS